MESKPGLQLFALSRFLHAIRFPLRSKTPYQCLIVDRQVRMNSNSVSARGGEVDPERIFSLTDSEMTKEQVARHLTGFFILLLSDEYWKTGKFDAATNLWLCS
jgi:hypothetical protein